MHHPSYLENISLVFSRRKDQNKDKQLVNAIKRMFSLKKKERIEIITKHLGIRANKICFIEHHLAHLAAAYYTAPNV